MSVHQQNNIWTKITHAYQQWDGDRSRLMSFDELYERLPNVDPEVITETLAAAHSEGKLDMAENSTGFRPIPNH